MTDIKRYIDELSHTYFGRWIQNYKVSFLVIALLIIYGSIVLRKIPKESTPDIKFGIVQITTVYP